MEKEKIIEEILNAVEKYDWTIVSPADNLITFMGLLDKETLSLIFTEIDLLNDKRDSK